MSHLLLLNPNTSASVTGRLLEVARTQAAGRTALPLHAVTARFGPRYITDELGAAVAAHAALDAYAAHVALHGVPAAVLLGCFGDPGLLALRALAPVPVLGLAEASMRAVARHGPLVVVTGGADWVPMLQRLAASLALPFPLCGVQALARTGGELAADPQLAVPLLADACAQALQRWPQATQVLLGGAGLAGMAAPVSALLGRPVHCNVSLAVDALLAATTSSTAATAAPSATHPHTPGRAAGGWVGLSPELSRLLSGPWPGPS